MKRIRRKETHVYFFFFHPFLPGAVLRRRSTCKDELKDHRVYFFLNLIETHAKKMTHLN